MWGIAEMNPLHENLVLPKWPQCVITGKAVSVEQAADIISRTDCFLGYFDSLGHGNNRMWEAEAKHLFGLTPYIDHAERAAESWGASADMNAVANTIFRRVETNYIKNDWLSSSYIFGAHGWCHPDGTIMFTDNVGKWPTVKEINEDLEALVKEFPYLDMAVTLMSGEQFDENKSAVITFVVKSGAVTTVLDSHELNHHAEPWFRDVDKMDFNARHEQGVSNEFLAALAARVKPLFTAAFPAFVGRNPIATPK